MSRRAGDLPLRMEKRVYFPYRPALLTRTSIPTPARKVRSSERRRTLPVPAAIRTESLRRLRARGQAVPRQRALTAVPAGARTDSRRIRTPPFVSEPAILTTGNGVMNETADVDGPEPVEPKLPFSSPPAGRLGVPAATGAGVVAGGDTAFALGFGLGGGGLRTVVVRTIVVVGGRVVVEGGVVVLGAVVDDGVVVDDPPVELPPVDDDPVVSSLPLSSARLATGPMASRAPMLAAARKASGERARRHTERPRQMSLGAMPEAR